MHKQAWYDSVPKYLNFLVQVLVTHFNQICLFEAKFGKIIDFSVVFKILKIRQVIAIVNILLYSVGRLWRRSVILCEHS